MLDFELEQQLIEHEGLRLTVYGCPAGKLTIGVGRNLEDKGITNDEAMQLLRNDIAECHEDLRTIFPGMCEYPDDVKRVLLDMRFNLGPNRFRKFKKMIRRVKERKWQDAAEEMRDSDWYKQVGIRGRTLAMMMEEAV